MGWRRQRERCEGGGVWSSEVNKFESNYRSNLGPLLPSPGAEMAGKKKTKKKKPRK